MKTTLRHEVKLQNQSCWPVGGEVSIRPLVLRNKEKETYNSATKMVMRYEKTGEATIIPADKLYKYSEDFVEITDEMIASAMMDGSCPSLTGADVEPDGWDPEGFPSILMAKGLV